MLGKVKVSFALQGPAGLGQEVKIGPPNVKEK